MHAHSWSAATTDPLTAFESVLYPARYGEPRAQARQEVTSETALHDLALDQAFARISQRAPRAAAAYRIPLASLEAVEYRQDFFRGLDHPSLRAGIDTFVKAMTSHDRKHAVAVRAHSLYQSQIWHLEAVDQYLNAAIDLRDCLKQHVPTLPRNYEAWTGLLHHVMAVCAKTDFVQLSQSARELSEDLARLRYNLLIHGARVTVSITDEESNLTEEVLSTFDRFTTGEVSDHRTRFAAPSFDHVQGWILEQVAKVHPDYFARLAKFTNETATYLDDALMRLGDEVHFYLAYLDYLEPMKDLGLATCFPKVSTTRKRVRATATWDLALAASLAETGRAAVTNDILLSGEERVLVISGPNQGGKTTTARIFGQLHHLAAIGCPVPGQDADLFLCDRVETLFERQEELDSLAGRLGTEIQRLHDLFARASSRTVIILNEAFSSTALADARILTEDVLERISKLDALAACVTFIDELSRLNEKTVSMVAAVDPDDPAIRTFKVERKPADGRAYAQALARKHHLSRAQIDSHFRSRCPIEVSVERHQRATDTSDRAGEATDVTSEEPTR